MIFAKRLLSCAAAILIFVSNGLNSFFNGDVYPFESLTKSIGLETLARSQGVTTDGESWIFSGKSALIRKSIDSDEILAVNIKPFKGLEEYGVSHIGGISYYDGFVYAALEDSKKWQSPMVAIYDAETLEFTGRYVLLDNTLLTRGCPWVCCDKERGLFYVAECSDTKELYCYDIESLSFVRTVQLGDTVDEIQGAEMYKGRMYAATNDSTRAVYCIDVETGRFNKCFDRIMYQPKLIDNFGGEGEDITVLEMDDGTVLHALDVGALFIDSNLRHYKLSD